MKKMYIYEPAMCCATGLCGVSVDPELLRISTVLSSLEKQGIKVWRYNLSGAPQAFVKNTEINQLMMNKGVEILPVTVVDNQIVKMGSYPTNQEIAELLEISEAAFHNAGTQSGNGGCGCSGGKCC